MHGEFLQNGSLVSQKVPEKVGRQRHEMTEPVNTHVPPFWHNVLANVSGQVFVAAVVVTPLPVVVAVVVVVVVVVGGAVVAGAISQNGPLKSPEQMQMAMFGPSTLHWPPFLQMVEVQMEEGVVSSRAGVVVGAVVVVASVAPANFSQKVPANPGAHLHVDCQVQVPPFWHG